MVVNINNHISLPYSSSPRLPLTDQLILLPIPYENVGRVSEAGEYGRYMQDMKYKYKDNSPFLSAYISPLSSSSHSSLPFQAVCRRGVERRLYRFKVGKYLIIILLIFFLIFCNNIIIRHTPLGLTDDKSDMKRTV